MANPYFGEVALTFDGKTLPMRLSLGALAELESEMKEDSLLSLVQRFENGSFKTADIIDLLFAGLRGAGWDGTKDDLMQADLQGGPLQAAKLAAVLLQRSFGAGDSGGDSGGEPA